MTEWGWLINREDGFGIENGAIVTEKSGAYIQDKRGTTYTMDRGR